LQQAVSQDSICLGDSQDKVTRLLAVPNSKSNSAQGVYETWKYKEGSIFFKNKLVVGWRNSSGIMKVKLIDQKYRRPEDVITRKSTIEDVVKIMGTPFYIDLSKFQGGRHYLTYNRMDRISFENGKLIGFDNSSDLYNVQFESTEKCLHDTLEIGSSLEQLLACYGTPKAIRSKTNSRSNWKYDDCTVTLINKKIDSWSNCAGRLNLK